MAMMITTGFVPVHAMDTFEIVFMAFLLPDPAAAKMLRRSELKLLRRAAV